MSTAIPIRIPDELAARLAEIAEETERRKSFHIQEAIEWPALGTLVSLYGFGALGTLVSL